MAEESKRERYGSGERYGAGTGTTHGTAQTPASNGRTGREAPVNARHGGGSSVGGR